MKDTLKINHGATLMVAHRGCSGLETENTNTAFIAAANRSYYGIETDVQRTLDGKYVLFHDDDTRRIGIDNLTITENTFETLRALTLIDTNTGKKGRTDLRIATLEEYVDTCKRYGKVGVLELKNPFTAEQVREIVDIIRDKDYLSGIIFITFHECDAIAVRELLPEHPVQFLCGECNDYVMDFISKYRLDVDMYYKGVTKEVVDKLHANGFKLNVWTVDDPVDAEAFVAMGVDFITTNIVE